MTREGSTLSREGSTLSREGSILTVNPQLPSLESPDSESGDLDAESSLSESQTSPAKEQKSGEDSNQEEKEKGETEVTSELEPPAESDVKGDGEEAPASDSSSELNNSCDSESLELQLSAADNGPLHIEEREDSPVTLSTLKSNGLENRDVSGLNSDTKDPGSPHKVCHLISTQLPGAAGFYELTSVLCPDSPVFHFCVVSRTLLQIQRRPMIPKAQRFKVSTL